MHLHALTANIMPSSAPPLKTTKLDLRFLEDTIISGVHWDLECIRADMFKLSNSTLAGPNHAILWEIIIASANATGLHHQISSYLSQCCDGDLHKVLPFLKAPIESPAVDILQAMIVRASALYYNPPARSLAFAKLISFHIRFISPLDFWSFRTNGAALVLDLDIDWVREFSHIGAHDGHGSTFDINGDLDLAYITYL